MVDKELFEDTIAKLNKWINSDYDSLKEKEVSALMINLFKIMREGDKEFYFYNINKEIGLPLCKFSFVSIGEHEHVLSTPFIFKSEHSDIYQFTFADLARCFIAGLFVLEYEEAVIV